MKQTKTMRTVGVAALAAPRSVPLGASPRAARPQWHVQEGQLDSAGPARRRAARRARRPRGRGRPQQGRDGVHQRHRGQRERGLGVGDQLTLKEGTKSVTYKTLTLTIPSGATIKRNGSTAQLSR